MSRQNQYRLRAAYIRHVEDEIKLTVELQSGEIRTYRLGDLYLVTKAQRNKEPKCYNYNELCQKFDQDEERG